MATSFRQPRKTQSSPAVPQLRRTDDPAGPSLISNAKLRELYGKMLECRLLQQRIDAATRAALRNRAARQDEALLVGIAVDLGREDWLVPSNRAKLAGLIKGLPPSAFLRRLQQDSASSKRAVSTEVGAVDERSALHIAAAASSAAAQIAFASGLALSLKSAGKGKVTVAYLDRVSLLHRPTREALLFAGAECLPLIFVAQSAVLRSEEGTPTGEPISSVAQGGSCSMPIIPVDASDVVALYRVAHESIHKARHGGGPTLIEAVSLAGTEGEDAKPGDPIVKMETYLRGKGLFSEAWQQRVGNRIALKLD